VAEGSRTFRCVVIAPAGRTLDCRATSVVFPAHDGQVGVLYNHMPMFCELGLGIMEVKSPRGEKISRDEEIRLLVDGGFALISSNLLTIIASDAIYRRDMEREKIEQMLEKSRRRLATPAGQPGGLTLQQREHEIKRNALLVRL